MAPLNRYQVVSAAAPSKHRESVVIDVARLQAHGAAGDVENARRDAVRPKPVDDRAVAALPERAADGEGRTDEQEVIELVEVPLVEQEAVERGEGVREPRRGRTVDEVHVIGDREPAQHEQARRQRD